MIMKILGYLLRNTEAMSRHVFMFIGSVDVVFKSVVKNALYITKF